MNSLKALTRAAGEAAGGGPCCEANGRQYTGHALHNANLEHPWAYSETG